MIIINQFFSPHSIHRQDGVVPVSRSNEQAVGKIAELLGLGVGQYLSKKKIQMLGNTQ